MEGLYSFSGLVLLVGQWVLPKINSTFNGLYSFIKILMIMVDVHLCKYGGTK